MIKFNATLEKFAEQGEKTGWTFFVVPAEIASKLKPNTKKSFRVKGKLDGFAIKQVALVPMGGGDFILPVNAAIRKGIGKRKGAQLNVLLEADDSAIAISEDLLACLENEPKAQEHFNQLHKGEQNYFSKWIDSAKTAATKEKRILFALKAFSLGLRFGPAMRALKDETK